MTTTTTTTNNNNNRDSSNGDWNEILYDSKPLFNYSFNVEMTDEKWTVEVRWPERGPVVSADYDYCFQLDIMTHMSSVPLPLPSHSGCGDGHPSLFPHQKKENIVRAFEFRREIKRSSSFKIAAWRGDAQEQEEDEDEAEDGGKVDDHRAAMQEAGASNAGPKKKRAARSQGDHNNNDDDDEDGRRDAAESPSFSKSKKSKSDKKKITTR